MANEKKPKKARGIVRKLDTKSAPTGGDVTFSPDYTVTSTDDKGGRVLTNVEVINAGIPGFASAEAVGTFFSEGHRFAPDYVVLYDEWNEAHYAPPPLLKRMVAAGLYGRKTGKGFYDYGKV